jgi:hypothetical protein
MNRVSWDWILAGALLFLAELALAAAQQGLTAKQNEIFLTAMAADGWLTEEMHRQFWAEIPNEILSDSQEVNAIVEGMDNVVTLANGFQWETWNSIRLSIEKKKPEHTPGYSGERDRLLSAWPRKEDRTGIEQSVANAEGMIDAAGKGTAFRSARGPMYLTSELVDNVLAGIEGAMFRLRRLGNPVWKSAVEERQYSDLHLRMLWDAPFSVSSRDLEIAGQKSKLLFIGSQLSANERVQVGFSKVASRFSDPASSVQRIAAAGLKAAGVESPLPIAGSWRGLTSAEAEGSSTTSAGTIHTSVRVLYSLLAVA